MNFFHINNFIFSSKDNFFHTNTNENFSFLLIFICFGQIKFFSLSISYVRSMTKHKRPFSLRTNISIKQTIRIQEKKRNKTSSILDIPKDILQ